MELLQRIADKQARIGVIGLGYVGLPLAVEFARAGFDVIGIDVDAAKVARSTPAPVYILDVPTADVAAVVAPGRCAPPPTRRTSPTST